MSDSEKEGIEHLREEHVLHAMKKDASDCTNSGETHVIFMSEHSLGTLNNYGDDLLNLSAANDCHNIIKEMIKTKESADINRNNDCGWTPLMQAIRNGNTEAVKLLLAKGYRPNEDTSQDISPIGLAAAMGITMFEIVYSACPAALEHAKYDKMSPLCAAVIREDMQLLLRLLELGVNVSEADEYTTMLMRQSRLPEIVQLAKSHPVAEDYWTENWDTTVCLEHFEDKFQDPRMSSTLNNIESSVECGQDYRNDRDATSGLPRFCLIPPSDRKISDDRNSESPGMNRPSYTDESKSLISPKLTYTRDQIFPISPNPPCFARKKEETSDMGDLSSDENIINFQDFHDDSIDSSNSHIFLNSTLNDEFTMHRYKINRPPDLIISKDDGGGAEYYLESSSTKPAVLPSKTPIEPRCETPLAAMILDADQKKMAILLQRFGLTHLIFTFLTQEVDLDLFLTLNDRDLREIGIESKSDRNILLSIIAERNGFNIDSTN